MKVKALFGHLQMDELPQQWPSDELPQLYSTPQFETTLNSYPLSVLYLDALRSLVYHAVRHVPQSSITFEIQK